MYLGLTGVCLILACVGFAIIRSMVRRVGLSFLWLAFGCFDCYGCGLLLLFCGLFVLVCIR